MNMIYVDVTRSCLVASPVNIARVLPPPLTIGDTVPVTLAFLQRNPQPLNTGQPIYNYVDMSAAGIVLSVATPTPAIPTLGDFALSFGSDMTDLLPWNCSSYDLTVALNALASIITAGGVTVSGNVGGPFFARFVANGAQALLTVAANALYPASSISVVQYQAGSTAVPESQAITLAQLTAAQVSFWAPQSAAAITVTSLQANIIQRVSIPAGTYGGSFTLTINSLTTPALPFNSQYDLIQAAINTLLGITTATVVAGQNYWDITIPANTFAFTGTATGLQIPLTLTGSLVLTSPALLALLNDQPSANLPLSIMATAAGQQTLYAGPVQVNTGPAIGAPAPQAGSILTIPMPAINGITGTSNSLDKTATASGVVAVGTIFILSLAAGGLISGQGWQLISNPPASNGQTSQRPLDYNASTNNVGWIQIW